MTIVGKLKISLHVEKSEILHIWHVFCVENVAIYAKHMQFCHNLRTFMWGKIVPKSTFVEKNDKYQV